MEPVKETTSVLPETTTTGGSPTGDDKEANGSKGIMEVKIMRLSGEELTLNVLEDCTLKDFKSLLVKHSIIDEALGMELLLVGVARINQQKLSSTMSQLGVRDGSCITVIKQRVHDYSRIAKLDHLVKSEKWPQGVLTTEDGLFYVCHFQGEVLVLNQELENVRKALLPREVSNPSQMAMAPNGDLVLACGDGRGGAVVAVVDSKTMEAKRWMRPKVTSGRGLGMAMGGGRVYLSHCWTTGDSAARTGDSAAREKRSKSVVVFDFETGEQVTTFDGFQHPCGLCVTDDRLFVADRGANEVRVLDLEGNPLDTIGGGELKIPNDVAVDNCGNVLVMDTGNERVAVFAPDGELVASVLPGTFKNRGNTHSYITVNPLTGTISVSMDDIHQVAVLAPPIWLV
ncbi:unnamed protein product [Durusdinium trenchii]|uniref:Ubiquitin-like domain-containing protein n=1 Tax=Durusdinium trenchii TaxID=1381693 RepID=A0ABP0J839_9DINO